MDAQSDRLQFLDILFGNIGKSDQILDSAMRDIFPDGFSKVPEEQRVIGILRFVATKMVPKKNPSSIPAEILMSGYGTSSNISVLFSALCDRVGIASRYAGAFNLKPDLGSFAAREVFYGNAWHFFDPMFGLFLYSHESYDGKGAVPSFREALSEPEKYFIFKTTAFPWSGKWGASLRTQSVGRLDAEYLKGRYSQSLQALYQKYLLEAFPVVCHDRPGVSFPVEADVSRETSVVFGKRDRSIQDVANLGATSPGFCGSFFLRENGCQPFHDFHTWAVQTEAPAILKIDYFFARDNPILDFFPLQGVRLLQVEQGESRQTFYVRATNPKCLFLVFLLAGVCEIDQMKIERLPVGSFSLEAPESAHEGSGEKQEGQGLQQA